MKRAIKLSTGVAFALATALLAISAGAQSDAMIDGFRSAKFDMTEEQVRQAIFADFKLRPQQIVRQVNKVDRTTILSVRASDLLPDSGVSQINYKLGFKRKRLIQVDVIWGRPIDPKVSTATLSAVIVNLRQYLLERGFAKERTVVNAKTKQDNVILVVRAEDEKARMVLLLGQFKLDAKAKPARILADQPEVVSLSYVLDPKNPDVFKIEKGKF